MTSSTNLDTRPATPADRSLDRRSGRHRAGRVTIRTLAAAGAFLLMALTTGTVLDILGVDPTSGGYEPPFTDYRGEPIDWDTDAYDTPTGMVGTGHVLDVHIDCTTGMISFDAMGVATFDYRRLSDRALAIHEPRQACQERGFTPQF